jgi:hypothetical protein
MSRRGDAYSRAYCNAVECIIWLVDCFFQVAQVSYILLRPFGQCLLDRALRCQQLGCISQSQIDSNVFGRDPPDTRAPRSLMPSAHTQGKLRQERTDVDSERAEGLSSIKLDEPTRGRSLLGSTGGPVRRQRLLPRHLIWRVAGDTTIHTANIPPPSGPKTHN